MGKLSDTLNKEGHETGAKHRFVYHTFFAEYAGDSPEDIINAVHKDAEAGTGLNFDLWWAYQAELWDFKYKLKVPDPKDPDAASKLLQILLDVGALENGPKPRKSTAPPSPGVKHG